MATPQPTETKQSLIKPLAIAAGVLVLIGLVMLLAGKISKPDPTLTAAPPSGQPGHVIMPSPEKQAKQQQIRDRANANMAALKAAYH